MLIPDSTQTDYTPIEAGTSSAVLTMPDAPASGFDVVLSLAIGGKVTQTQALAILLREAQDRPGGCARADRAHRVRARNRALLDAGTALAGDNPSPWVLAGRLEQAIARFKARLWPLLCAGLHRGELSPHEAALHRAFLTGERVPGTQRRLYDLLTN